MSKKKKNWKNELKRCKSIKAYSSKLSKKGRIKGKNKKETMTLRGMCCHHIITKKGKLKPTLETYDKDTKICRVCTHTFNPNFHEGDKLRQTIDNGREIIDQMKFALVALGAKPETIDFVCQAGGYWEHIEKLYKKTVSIVKKRNSLKVKNKKSDRSKIFNEWRIRQQ
mgnify:CR=1 FL=1